jgi:cyclic pyranopterin phosphate synthase
LVWFEAGTVILETASFAPVIGKRMEVIKQQIRPFSDASVQPVHPLIQDLFGRNFNYLRIALNEQCNLRCIYCMPEKGISFRTEDKLLSIEEIFRVINIFSNMGVSKIRFTGGEPLLRNDLTDLIQYANETIGIKSIHLTTNGLLLSKHIKLLENTGLSGINISLDTLNTKKYKTITRRNKLNLVMEGIEKAIQSSIPSIKINVVAMRDFNNNELLDFVALTKENNITVRFIELMPFDSHQIWKTGKFYGADHIVTDLKTRINELELVEGSQTEHHIFRVKGYKGKVAVIPAYSRNLCGECNRIRITADGKLLNCLYSQEETNIRDAMREGVSDSEIGKIIKNTMLKKFRDGWEAQHHGKDHRESMTQIGG